MSRASLASDLATAPRPSRAGDLALQAIFFVPASILNVLLPAVVIIPDASLHVLLRACGRRSKFSPLTKVLPFRTVYKMTFVNMVALTSLRLRTTGKLPKSLSLEQAKASHVVRGLAHLPIWQRASSR